MPSYMSTPLFSIQEVASSTVSIPKEPEIYQDNEENEEMNNEGIELFKNFLYDYKISETNYYQELTSLLELVNSFDPVYNNYFDHSLDDITDELINSRKKQNLNLIKLIRTLLFKHCELIKLLSIKKLDLLIIKISEWGLSINSVYLDFVNLYRLDINQSNYEIKLFRRPLIRIRYLNNFYLNLRKNYFNIFKVEQFFTKELLSNFEIINFKLKECLRLARLKDENEKVRCESIVNISDVKDIISLNKISVNPNFNKNFEEKFFNCEFYYNNNFEKRSINLKNIQFIFSNHSKINQVGILEIENFGKKLLFQPLKQNEFKFNKKIKKNFLSFSHSIHNNKIEFFVKLKDDNRDDNEKFEKKLLELFPNDDANRVSDDAGDINIKKFDKPSFGLKVRSEKEDNESDNDQRSQNAIPLYKLSFTSNSAPVLSTGLSKYLDTENQSENKRKSSMIDLRITKTELIDESKQQKQRFNSRREQLSQKILQDVIDDINSSDDEEFGDKENNDTTKLIHSPPPLVKDLTSPSPVTSPEPAPKLTPINAIPNQQKIYNFEKYQNSFSNSSLNLTAKPKKKRQSIFNMLSTILTKNNQQSTDSPTVSPVNSNNSNNKDANIHNDSLIPDSLLSKINDPKLSTYAELSNVRFSIWTSHSWTIPKSSKLRLIHSGSVIYLAFYGENQTNIIDNKPLLLVQLNKQSTIRTTTLDIHLKTINYLNEKIMILIRTPNKQSLLRVKNAIYDPYGIESLSNSSSYRSDLSKISAVSRSTTVSNLSSNISPKQNLYSNLNSNSTLKINKSWSGAANAFLIENKSKLKNLDRCVVNVSSSNNRTDVELIGYQFGTIELSLLGKNVRRMENLSIIIEDNDNGNNNNNNNYLLSFDNEVDVSNFFKIIN